MDVTIRITDGGPEGEDEIPSLVGVPPDTVLPVWACSPKLLGQHKSKLAPAQLALLKAYTWLDPARQKAMWEGAHPKEAISYQLLQQAVDEQLRERGLWSDTALSLEDTTKSELE